MDRELSKIIKKLNNEFIEFWTDICNIKSPTEYKEGVDAVGRKFTEYAYSMGWEVEIHREKTAGDAVCITMNSNAEGRPVVFSGHMDTVYSIDKFPDTPARKEGGRLYGQGATDCKGGITAALMAMKALDIYGFDKRPVKLLLQSDEENGSLFSNKATVDFMIEKAGDCCAFLNCESHRRGGVAMRRKGILRYEFTISGIRAHASNCYRGASAVREAAYKIIELEKMKDMDGITVNCGTINGGSSANTVPGLCTFTADVRFATSEEMKQATEYVEGIGRKTFVSGTKTQVRQINMRRPMEETEKNMELFDRINCILKENGMPALRAEMARGGSDASDMTYAGIPCIDSMGVVGRYIHSEGEYAVISSLGEAAERLAVVAMYI